MKIFIAFLLIFSSFSDGKNLGDPTEPPAINPQTPSPTADVTVNVTWTFTSGVDITNVGMVIKNLKASEWAAVGLGQHVGMNEAHVFVCKRLSNDTILINRYVNPGNYTPPQPAGSEQGGQFTPLPSQFVDGIVTCQFNLSNFSTQPFKQVGDLKPLSQSGFYHPLFAVGMLDSNNIMHKHADDSRTALLRFARLNQNDNIRFKVTSPSALPDRSSDLVDAKP